MTVGLLRQSDDVLVSPNDVGAVGVARELKELTTDPAEVVVRPEAARANLATCAWHGTDQCEMGSGGWLTSERSREQG